MPASPRSTAPREAAPPPLFAPAREDVAPFTASDLFTLAFKHLRTVALCFIVVTGLVAAGVSSLPPTYVASAKVLIKTEQQGNPSFLSGVTAYREGRDVDPSNRKLETEMEIVSARPLAERVVSALGIQAESLYQPPYVHLMEWLSPVLNVVGLGSPERDSDPARAATSTFLQALSVEPAESRSGDTRSNVFRLELRTRDPELASTAINRLLDEYLRYGASLTEGGGSEALGIVRESLSRASDDVEAAQRRLNRVLEETGMTLRPVPTAPAGAGAEMLQRAAASEQQRRELRSEPRGSDSARQQMALGDSRQLVQLKARLTDAELELARLRLTYTESSDIVQQVRRTVQDLRTRIEQESTRNAENEVALFALQQDLEVARERQQDLEKKAEEINLFLEMNPSQMNTRVVIEPAIAPRESQWKKSVLIIVLGSLAGLFLGIALAGVGELIDPRLQDARAVQRELGLRVVGEIPALKRKELRHALQS